MREKRPLWDADPGTCSGVAENKPPAPPPGQQAASSPMLEAGGERTAGSLCSEETMEKRGRKPLMYSPPSPLWTCEYRVTRGEGNCVMPGVVLLVSGPPEPVLVQRIMPRCGAKLSSESLCFPKMLDAQRSGLPCAGDGSLTLA